MSNARATRVSVAELLEFIDELNRVLALGSAVTEEERWLLLTRKESILRRMGRGEELPGVREAIAQAWPHVGKEPAASRSADGGEW